MSETVPMKRPDLPREMKTMSETAPEYPGYGSACNGCGLCCAAEPCEIAREFAGITQAPCAAMEFDDDRFVCGMVKNPSKYAGTPAYGDAMIGAMFATALGIGKGCDSEPLTNPTCKSGSLSHEIDLRPIVSPAG